MTRWLDQLDNELVRIRILIMLMVSAFAFLVIKLCDIQVFRRAEYRNSLMKQSVRRIRVPGPRGAILDRNRVLLAGNRPSYCIAIYTEELRRPGRLKNTVDAVDDVVKKVSAALGLERQVSREDITAHLSKRRPMPLLAWSDIDKRALARFMEQDLRISGVEISVESIRVYPFGKVAAHALGHVGSTEASAQDEVVYHYCLPDADGRDGIEKSMQQELTGIPGENLIRVDASGYRRGVVGHRMPVAGGDLVLTIDIRIQQMLEDAMGKDHRGAGVVMDPRNGEILAMASYPDFDPNDFSSAMTRGEWVRLQENPAKPLMNRAVTGLYPPGSTFKPIVALAALENGRATPATGFSCPGAFALGPVVFHCWQKSGHGYLTMEKGIQQSCNVYFCQLGLLCGHEKIIQTAEGAGMGTKTGIDIGGESAGLVPDPKWKERRMKEGWRKGDTCNMSIGQGALLATPLQMALVTSVFANGGEGYRPHLVRDTHRRSLPIRRLKCNPRSMRVVRSGMHEVVNGEGGTGKRAAVKGVEMAGKTGTAEYGPKEDRKKYTWMTLFAPYEDPRYVAVIVLEEGMSGGSTVAPKIRTLMEGVFRLDGTISQAADGDKAG